METEGLLLSFKVIERLLVALLTLNFFGSSVDAEILSSMVSLPLKFGEFAVEIVTGSIPEVGIVNATDLVVDVSIAVPSTAVISPALFSLNWRVTPKFSAGSQESLA